MHRELKELLHGAEGDSQRVFSVFLDVRGFSSFARIAESSDAAEFLRSAYLRILDDYFPNVDFFKLTGDGLLIIRRYDRESLKQIAREVVDASLRLVEAFSTICAGDPMVNFPVPRYLGVGISRGAATALVSGDKILDYTGRPLNLSARLMDIARPSGAIFDESFGIDLLDEPIRERFFEQEVYLSGIAEDQSLLAYCLEGTEVPEFNKHPINSYTRVTDPELSYTLSEFEELSTFRHQLKREPAAVDDIIVHVSYPDIQKNGRKHPKRRRNLSEPAQYLALKGKHYARLDYRPMAAKIRNFGAKDSWEIRTAIEYSTQD